MRLLELEGLSKWRGPCSLTPGPKASLSCCASPQRLLTAMGGTWETAPPAPQHSPSLRTPTLSTSCYWDLHPYQAQVQLQLITMATWGFSRPPLQPWATRVCCVSLLGLLWQNTADWWLQQQKCIFSQFWRWQVQDQGVSKFGVFQALATCLANDHFVIVSSHGLCSVHVPGVPSSSKDTYWIRTLPMTSISLNFLFKSPVSKYSHILR